MRLALLREAPAARRPRRRRGLMMIALFLGLSGLIRIGDGIGHALAETSSHGTEPPMTEAAAGAECTPDGGASALLDALKLREARVREQELAQENEAQTLALARAEIEEKIAALTAAEEKLAATVQQADKAAEKDVAKLVAVYETMKPKDAAKLFSEMDPDFAAGFLAQMQPAAAAAVLAGIEPSKAYTISLMLAGRNANAPKS
ncbi:hypothetical protein OU426_07920 [Frigidibacter sp. RF13]|uniref:MotE family protein n=1 Tax=Frigidibacter sp. RF13 TaxID=2997340 RepID=UPI0022706299|nr:hypothetical protein [Frigidibacter sp. RF13]MCY1126775.1 hypothetical protein [Frigidibacter sp. RF13]